MRWRRSPALDAAPVDGLAVSGGRHRLLTGIYVATFLLVLFYAEVPWPGLLLDVLSRYG